MEEQHAGREPEISNSDAEGRVEAGGAMTDHGSKEEGSRDYAAMGFVAAALAALVLCGYFAVGHLRGGTGLSPQRGVVEWMETLDQYGRDLLSRIPGAVISRGDPVRDSERHVRRAYGHYTKNRLKEALEECGKAIRLDPGNPKAYFWRGLVHVKARRYDPALEDFRKAVELKPDFREAHDNLGWIYSRRNRPDEAITHLTRSIELSPQNAWAYHLRAQVFLGKGDGERALGDAKKACELKYEDGCKLYEEVRSKGNRT